MCCFEKVIIFAIYNTYIAHYSQIICSNVISINLLSIFKMVAHIASYVYVVEHHKKLEILSNTINQNKRHMPTVTGGVERALMSSEIRKLCVSYLHVHHFCLLCSVIVVQSI